MKAIIGNILMFIGFIIFIGGLTYAAVCLVHPVFGIIIGGLFLGILGFIINYDKLLR